jgi:hypothetical protein
MQGHVHTYCLCVVFGSEQELGRAVPDGDDHWVDVTQPLERVVEYARHAQVSCGLNVARRKKQTLRHARVG